MNWYYAEAGQQKGPVTEEQLDGLARDGVVKPDTLVWREGLADWQPHSVARGGGAPPPPPMLATGASAICSQCGRTFTADEVVPLGGGLVCASCKPIAIQRLQEGVGQGAPGATMTVAELEARDYEVRTGSCLSRSWALMKARFWLVVGAFFIVMMLLNVGPGIVSNVLGFIPILGILISLAISLAAFVVSGPMNGGLQGLMVRTARGEAVAVGSIFDGFKKRFLQLMLTHIVTSLLTLIPIIVMAMVAGVCGAILGVGISQKGLSSGITVGLIVTLSVVLFLGLAVAVYLAVRWSFSLWLVMDKKLNFWPAMTLSWRTVGKHWWRVCWFRFVAGIVGGIGFLVIGIPGIVCIVLAVTGKAGVAVGIAGGGALLLAVLSTLVTGPLALGMITHLYNDIFGPLAPAEG